MKTSFIKALVIAGVAIAPLAIQAGDKELTAAEKFAKIDTDGNGSVTLAEFEAHMSAKSEVHNRSAETNQSGARTDNKSLRTNSSTGAVNDGTTNLDETAKKAGVPSESAVTPPQK